MQRRTTNARIPAPGTSKPIKLLWPELLPPSAIGNCTILRPLIVALYLCSYEAFPGPPLLLENNINGRVSIVVSKDI
jgi:hypothetical protein